MNHQIKKCCDNYLNAIFEIMCSILELAYMQTNDIESLKQKILGKNTDYRRLWSSAFTLLSYWRNQAQKGEDIFVQEYI